MGELFSDATNVVLVIFWGVVLLSLVVVIHEGGHYLAARAFGVRVLEFMVGLPGPSIGYRPKKSRTRFGVTAVPLGGYARIAGMDEWQDEKYFPQATEYLYTRGQMEGAEVDKACEELDYDLDACLDALSEWGTVQRIKLKHGDVRYAAPEVDGYALGQPRHVDDYEAFIASERSQMYVSLPWWKRLVILFAGPGANLLTAIIVVTLVLSTVGTTQATLTLADVPADRPAYAAGMRPGDTIVAVDGQTIGTWAEFTQLISAKQVGSDVDITYQRDDVQATAHIQTVASDDGSPIVGVVSQAQQVALSPIDAMGQAFAYIGEVTVAIVGLINPATTMQVVSQSTSIIGISVVAKQAAELGFINFIWLAAVISISIGLMNLLPLMPLDGGRIIMETIQKIRRRVLSIRFINGYSTVGIVLVMLLFVVVMGQDIHNVVTGSFPV